MKDDARVNNAKLSALAQMDRASAVRNLFNEQMINEYQIRMAAKCMQPCLTNMDSATMSQ